MNTCKLDRTMNLQYLEYGMLRACTILSCCDAKILLNFATNGTPYTSLRCKLRYALVMLHFAHAHANCTRLLDHRVEPGDEVTSILSGTWFACWSWISFSVHTSGDLVLNTTDQSDQCIYSALLIMPLCL